MAKFLRSEQITMQKDSSRHTLRKDYYDDGVPRCVIIHEQNHILGGSMSFEWCSKVRLADFYYDLIGRGFKLFRNPSEVTWYATMDNNTPYAEEWTTKGIYLIPIRSRVLEAAQ